MTPDPDTATGSEPVRYEVDGHVATITLNRPHRRNAISAPMLVRLGESSRLLPGFAKRGVVPESGDADHIRPMHAPRDGPGRI